MKQENQMAIIRGPVLGVDDRDQVTLRFTTYTSEHSAAYQRLSLVDAGELIGAYGVQDVHLLDGKPIRVRLDGTLLRVVGPCLL